MCAWGGLLIVVGALRHHVSVLGILAGAIFLAAGLRWFSLTLMGRAGEAGQAGEHDPDPPAAGRGAAPPETR